jgi:hypothetical protein
MTEILENVGGVFTKILNQFPKSIKEAIAPLLDGTNAAIQTVFGIKFKFSPGGSRNIQQELESFAKLRAPETFFFGSRGLIGAGLAEALTQAGLSGAVPGVRAAFPIPPAGASESDIRLADALRVQGNSFEDQEKFLEAISKLVGITSQLATLKVSKFLPDSEIAGVEEKLNTLFAVRRGEDFPKALETFQTGIQPQLDIINQFISQSTDLFGRGLMAALEATSESSALAAFNKNLGEGVKDVIFQGITTAFIQSAQFNDLLAPIQKTIREFTLQAVESGETPDIDAFRRAILPEIEDLSARADLSGPLLEALQALGLDITSSINSLFGGRNAAPFVINIENFTGSDEDVNSLAHKIDDLLRGANPPS